MKKNLKPMKITRPRHPPSLRFTPPAWAKLLCLRDVGETEIGGFGITAAEDRLLVQDVVLVRQLCTPVHVEFDDAAVADLFDQQVDLGRRPDEFARIWVHTHPGDSPAPSSTDEETFARVFGPCDWAVMAILARGGQSYARLRFNLGPGADVLLPVLVDYCPPFDGTDELAWLEEYEQCVCVEPREERPKTSAAKQSELREFDQRWEDAWFEYANPDLFQEASHGEFQRDF
jgi:proteasome lid subunit RPN8/RPN11